MASYEEDARLKTEEPEEEDEKDCEEHSGMSSASVNKLQILWDHFIHAETRSYEVFYRFLRSVLQNPCDKDLLYTEINFVKLNINYN